MKKYFQKFLNNFFPPAYLTLNFFGLGKYDSVIDLGCGFESILKSFNNKYKLGVDIFEEYLAISKAKNIHHEYLLENVLAERTLKLLKNFEAVICFDVLEHLTSEEAEKLITSIENSEPKFIAFRTPATFVIQDEYHNNPYQIHKSFINPDYFRKRGYKVYGVDGPSFLLLRDGKVVLDLPFYKTVFSYLLRPIFYFFPEKSLNYLAIKN